jgi:hypothetical protein
MNITDVYMIDDSNIDYDFVVRSIETAVFRVLFIFSFNKIISKLFIQSRLNRDCIKTRLYKY